MLHEEMKETACADCGVLLEEGEEYYNDNDELICECCNELLHMRRLRRHGDQIDNT